MNKKLLFGLMLLITQQLLSQEQRAFTSPKGTVLVSTDLHIHTVFSDGSVWPDIRLEEARREGLDMIAITEHIEYQPHREDIPHPDRNRSFELARRFRKDEDRLQVINGAEITRSMAPGHINAVFLQDANGLLAKDSLSGIIEANNQGAFVFWNHPTWDAQRPSGIARLDPYHEYLIEKKLLHGIEVVNENTFSEEAFQLALDNKLTILGNSDIHGLTDWLFEIPKGGHRPQTFVLAKSNNQEDVKQALFEGKTVVWYNDLLLGEKKHIEDVLKSNLLAFCKGYGANNILAKVNLINSSALPIQLEYQGEFSFYNHPVVMTVPAFGAIELQVKTKQKVENFNLSFRILNALIGPRENPLINFNLKTK